MRSDLATNSSGQDERFEDNGAGFAAEGLEVEFEDGHTSRGFDYGVEVVQAKEHGDHVEPCSDKADGDCSHYRDGDGSLGGSDFFSHVCCGIETRKHPVGID